MAKRKTEIVNWVLIAALLLCCAAGFAVQKHSGTVSALLCGPEKFESLQAGRTPSETELVTAEPGREATLKILGSIVENEDMSAVVRGDVRVISSDIPVKSE